MVLNQLLMVLSLQCFSSQSTLFHEVENARGKTSTSSLIGDLSAALNTECALHCANSNSCHSFFHDENNKTCRLIGGHLTQNHMYGSTNQTAYYKDDTAGVMLNFCPTDFDNEFLPNVCFKKVDRLGISAVDADTVCKSYSDGDFVGHLLTYHVGMHNKLESLLSTYNYFYYIDGFKKVPELTWVDWKGHGLSWINWLDDEPDNGNNEDPTHEQCMCVDSAAKVHDIPCETNYTDSGVLCQLERFQSSP